MNRPNELDLELAARLPRPVRNKITEVLLAYIYEIVDDGVPSDAEDYSEQRLELEIALWALVYFPPELEEDPNASLTDRRADVLELWREAVDAREDRSHEKN